MVRENKGAQKKGILFLGTALLLVLTAAAFLPVFYESQSLYYKFGMAKTLLLLGKGAGFAALVLMVVQIVFISRFTPLVKMVGTGALFSFHKVLGTGAGIFVLLHPLFILWADGFSLFPMELRYWPEFLGAFTLICLALLIGTALFRARFHLSHKVWLRSHRLFAPGIILMGFVHAGFVSETFDHRVPKLCLALAGGIALVMLARIYINRRTG